MDPLGLDLSALAGSADPETTALLDVARAEFVSHGFRRTSVGDIARRAGVSRPTVYRRIGDKDQVARTVVLREVLHFFLNAAVRFIALPTAGERTVECFVAGVVELRRNDLAQAVLEYEPEALLALGGTTHGHALELVRDAIAVGLAGQDLAVEAARPAAELILRITASLLVEPSDLLPLETADDARRFATTYFLPIVETALRHHPA